MNYKIIYHIFIIGFFLFFNPAIYGQNDTLKGIGKLKQLINSNNIELANKELQSQINHFKSLKNYDTLTHYIPFVGSYVLSNKNRDFALSKAIAFVNDLKKQQNPSITTKALKELAWIYEENGTPDLAYNTLKDALVFANKLKDKRNIVIADFNYNMGYYATVMGDYPLSKKHYFKSLQLSEQEKTKDYVFSQQIYNALGGVMWREGKLDSSDYFFNQSLKALKNTDNDPMNTFYRPSLISMNLAVLYNMLGKNSEAISFSENAIKGFGDYINIEENEQQKNAAKKNQLVAIDNLGVFYNTLGAFTEADKMLSYAYNQKKNMLGNNHPDVIISKILLAQSKLNNLDYKGAAELLNDALKTIETNSLNQLYWHASALLTLGKVYEQNQEPEKATEYYNKAEAVFRTSLGGGFNDDFLVALNNMGLFYAKNDQKTKAIKIAEETYQVIQKGDFKNTKQELLNLTKIAEIYYQLKDYKKAQEMSLEVINFKISLDNKTAKDSVLFQFDKPKAIYINTSSTYHLTNNKTSKLLLSLLEQVDGGIKILEQRKSITNNSDDVTKLIADNSDLFNFAKQLRLDLFRITKNNVYLNDLITTHESSIYNRIRSRLNLNNNLTFSNIPKKITDRETALKNNISKSLINTENIKSYLEANTKWSLFLDSLKHNYPKYYKMRYASLEEPLDNLQKKIPKNTTLIRYLYIDKTLFAVLITEAKKHIFKLDSKNVKENIALLAENQTDIKSTSAIYFKLYQKLWKPFENHTATENVIIFPDAELFNLSFETLTSQKINSFKELASKSLLAKYIISYNYSLLLLDKNRKTINYKNPFIAFAPEFNDEMKRDYKVSIKDSISIDKTYLKLLPQPFSVDVVKEYSQIFKGTYFINENASKQIFKQEANEHKIIHIGTHAESNNVSPELSRLIFAKNTNDDDNSLYTYEIYNQNLNSNLAILTACETGKPIYQAGEGMISLAHAFNYAGSESILTSLWKIDEQSSAKIIEYFYNNLKKGMPKDKALQKAKLSYIESATERTITPQYWAGLVLIGNTSPIDLNTSSYTIWYVFGSILVIIFLVALLKNRL